MPEPADLKAYADLYAYVAWVPREVNLNNFDWNLQVTQSEAAGALNTLRGRVAQERSMTMAAHARLLGTAYGDAALQDLALRLAMAKVAQLALSKAISATGNNPEAIVNDFAATVSDLVGRLRGEARSIPTSSPVSVAGAGSGVNAPGAKPGGAVAGFGGPGAQRIRPR